MASIKCGHCKGVHRSVPEVRGCYFFGNGSSRSTVEAVVANESGLPALLAPAATSHQSESDELFEGRFAIPFEGKFRFFKVDMPTSGKWSGYTFVKEQASDELWPVRGNRARLVREAIRAAGPREAAIAYGRELGVCSICGRTLTDEASRAAGIGPVCSSKMGW